MKQTLLTTITASALILGAVSVAQAGRDGSASRVQNAIATGSQDAIVAEVERIEKLICGACVAPIMDLLEDPRYEIREVAAWWFAKRPVYMAELTMRSLADLEGNDSIRARNAADILGAFEHPQAVEGLSRAALRDDLSPEARRHVVRALGNIGHDSANIALQGAMLDTDAGVRFEALSAWMEIRRQDNALPAIPLIADSDVVVRRKATAVAGKLRESGARAALELQLQDDADASVRRNAAWALGRIGDPASRAALQAATMDASGLVRTTARVALRNLR